MPEIENELILVVPIDKTKFDTRTNGDKISIWGLHLTAGQAGTLAYLINSSCELRIEIKANEE